MAAFIFSCLLLVLAMMSSPASTEFSCDHHDKKALIAFRDYYGHPSKFPSWTEDTLCCIEWHGVNCNVTTGRVVSLVISQDDTLTGGIPPAIADLPYLDNFYFHKLPKLVGPIPPQITKLKRLRSISISWTSLSGSIPPFLADLPSLVSLDLSFNNLTGSIPASLAEPELYALDLSRNRLSGSIPPNLMSRSPSPASLILSHNQLTGAIPLSLGSVAFSSIDLSRNQLTGDAYVLFGKNKSTVSSIVLSRNQFEFVLSSVEFPEESLDVLDLSHNKIFGVIPAQIANVPNLQFLNVSYNMLCGTVPTGGQMGRFDQSSYIHNKCLCGTPLPPCKA